VNGVTQFIDCFQNCVDSGRLQIVSHVKETLRILSGMAYYVRNNLLFHHDAKFGKLPSTIELHPRRLCILRGMFAILKSTFFNSGASTVITVDVTVLWIIAIVFKAIVWLWR